VPRLLGPDLSRASASLRGKGKDLGSFPELGEPERGDFQLDGFEVPPAPQTCRDPVAVGYLALHPNDFFLFTFITRPVRTKDPNSCVHGRSLPPEHVRAVHARRLIRRDRQDIQSEATKGKLLLALVSGVIRQYGSLIHYTQISTWPTPLNPILLNPVSTSCTL